MTPTGSAITAGVIGQPISHSLSPLMMTAWIRDAGLDAVYTPYIATPHMFAPVVHSLFRAGLKGLNVTLPHKTQALTIAHRISDCADRIGAANLLTSVDGEVHADNTDAAGFIGALKASGHDPDAKSALVLGAGGAARAIVYGLIEAGASNIIICNRSADKAHAIRDDLAPSAHTGGWDERNDALADADIVVNATSLGLRDQPELGMDWAQARPDCVVADSVYVPLETGFLRTARMAGLATVDGLGMLIEQGKPSFEAFFGTAVPAGTDIHGLLSARLAETA